MKQYEVLHQTIYEFDSPVQLQAHTLRLRPREDHEQRLEVSTLTIYPNASVKWHRDAQDNSLAVATFSQSTNRLVIENKAIVTKLGTLPHDFLVSDDAITYPFAYPSEDKCTLQPYLDNSAQHSLQLNDWINTFWDKTHTIQTFELLLLINQQVYGAIRYRRRDEEGVQSSNFTLRNSSGSCRDIANLYIDVVRHLGFAARFVSGYVQTMSQNNVAGTTHAWTEVFIPGAGWKGFDPSHGCLVGDQHIAVAISRLPNRIPPVAGSYLGQAKASLDVAVYVTDISEQFNSTD